REHDELAAAQRLEGGYARRQLLEIPLVHHDIGLEFGLQVLLEMERGLYEEAGRPLVYQYVVYPELLPQCEHLGFAVLHQPDGAPFYVEEVVGAAHDLVRLALELRVHDRDDAILYRVLYPYGREQVLAEVRLHRFGDGLVFHRRRYYEADLLGLGEEIDHAVQAPGGQGDQDPGIAEYVFCHMINPRGTSSRS